jgi:hypothetical protein
MHLVLVSSKIISTILFKLLLFHQLIFISITIVLGTDHIVMSLQVKSNRNVLSYKVVSDSFDWRTKGVVTPVQDYSESPHVAGVVMVGK